MIDKEVMDLGGGATTPIRNRGKKVAKERRATIEIELDDTSFMLLAKRAHELDITFNQLVSKILEEQMDKKEPNSRWH